MSPVKISEDYVANVIQDLLEQRESEEFCDVVLIAGTEETRIPAHRCILFAASDYFKEMFMSKSTGREIKMSNVDSDILQILVQYCYTGHFKINGDRLVELLKTAQILLLRNMLSDFPANVFVLAEELHPQNCLEFAQLAEQYRCESLLQKAKDYSLEYFVAVRETGEFLNLNAEQLSELLSSDHLNVYSEEDVFKAFKDWIDCNRIEREKHLAELLKLVRLPFLGISFLKEHVKPICTSMDCRQIYTEALEQELTQQYVLENERCPVKSKQFLMGISITDMGIMDIQYYCTHRLKWMKWSKTLKCRCWAGVAFVENNLYLVEQEFNSRVVNTVVCLNLKTMNYVEVRPMLELRTSCRAAGLNGFLYAVGGKNSDRSHLNSVEKWNSNSNTWSKVASMAVGRWSFGLAVLNEKLYAVGGFSSSGRGNSAECYDPLQDVWMPIASMHEARKSCDLVVCKGLLYAVGEHWNETVESYNPDTNCWTMLCSLKDCSINFHIATFRDRVIVFHSDRVEEYDVENNEWKRSASLKSLQNCDRIFTYSGELLRTEFVEN